MLAENKQDPRECKSEIKRIQQNNFRTYQDTTEYQQSINMK